MIKKKLEQAMTSFKDVFGNNVSWPKVESDDISVNMDGGVGGGRAVDYSRRSCYSYTNVDRCVILELSTNNFKLFQIEGH